MACLGEADADISYAERAYSRIGPRSVEAMQITPQSLSPNTYVCLQRAESDRVSIGRTATACGRDGRLECKEKRKMLPFRIKIT